ncbi:MAG: glucose 1-dehydrogenase [Actinobacteria bacterium]|jgi:3alpha(or 20beta)-hydroxysteroid dehydrogenase|nr:glucose 1-dehydrogenase [Ilumatobacteraceae bacterium]MDA0300094.1 glucose 1-dehydrogenase [Actinomycetota bacterium]MDA2961565.1 glucose 1-dehydrogenase [Actinomycetota bacterium]MDA2994908.1 glucose 1-dehydrogenase [Actinomycetota bacterium]
MTSLSGLTAIVTGAAGAMGEQEARKLAERGANVVLTDVRQEEGEAIANDIGDAAIFVQHDVSSESGWNTVIETALSTFGSVNVLVNNAAISKAFKLIDTDVDTFDLVYRVNQLGVFLGMKSVVEPMKAAGGGSIINISSVAGLQGTSTIFAYSASKWAVRGMTQSAALELARYKIRVNSVFPGVIDTPMNDANPPGMNEVLVKTTPLRRMGQASEVAEAVVFLASPQASFATGAELAIDGGMSI